MPQTWMELLLEDMRTKFVDDNFMLDGLERMASALESLEYYVFRSLHLERLSEHLTDASSNDELSEYLNELAYEAGFRYATVMVIEYGCRTPRTVRMMTTCRDDWIDTFVRDEQWFIDPVIERASVYAGPIFCGRSDPDGGEAEWVSKNTDATSEQMEAFALSVHMPDGAKGVVCFYHPIDSSVMQSRRHHKLSDVLQVSRDFFIAFLEINSVEHNIDDLSDAEKRFLSTLAYSSNPADALSIVPAFGSNSSLQRSLMNKLKVDTLFQASAVAAKMNIINYVHPTHSEIAKPKRNMIGHELLKVHEKKSASC